MPAPKKNKFALGNKGGKPRLWDDPVELEDAIDEYFDYCDMHKISVWAKQLDKNGNPVKLQVPTPYTIEDLGIWLKCHRQTLLNYQKQDGYEEYFDIITHAKERIAAQRTRLALIGAYDSNFTRFSLMNMNLGMSEKGEMINTNLNQDLPPLSPERAKAIAKKLEDEV
jgi:hypothetical protein